MTTVAPVAEQKNDFLIQDVDNLQNYGIVISSIIRKSSI